MLLACVEKLGHLVPLEVQKLGAFERKPLKLDFGR